MFVSVVDEPVRNVSLMTKVWGLVVRLVSGYQPTTYSYQKSLPFLPVPDLKETLNKFLTSIEPLYGKDSDTYNKFKLQADVSVVIKGGGGGGCI